MKMILKRMVIDIVCVVFRILQFPQNVVILESVPDFEGSPRCIAEEINRRYKGKYRFLWAVEKDVRYLKDKNVVFFWGKLSLWDKLRKYFYLLRVKLIVDSNRPVYKETKNGVRLFTRHGGTLKKNEKYMKSIGPVDYVLSLSPFLADIDYKILKGTSVSQRCQVLSLGYPVNDLLFAKFDIYDCDLLKGKSYTKIIAWLPTYRNHKNKDESISLNQTGCFTLPIVHTLEDVNLLNQILQELNVLLILQLHPAQEAVMPRQNYSHICYLTQEKKNKNGIETPNLLHCSDALITDYSAAYYEYILLNKPIGLSIDDIDDYMEKIGFYVDYDELIQGERLKKLDDLISFIRNVVQGKDFCLEGRTASQRKIHQYVDNLSTQRVVDFLSAQVGL